jgi:hypothetical protein
MDVIIAAGINAAALIAVALIGIAGRRRISREVAGVHREVRSSNGLTLAALADATEGRRIQNDIPPADRTPSQQHYVDDLDP